MSLFRKPEKSTGVTPGEVTVPDSLNRFGDWAVNNHGLSIPANGGILLPADLDPPELSIPSNDEVALLVNNDEEAIRSRREHSQAITFFLAKPWNYLESRLKEAGVEPIISEIADLVDETKKKIGSLPVTLTDDQLSDLRSPIQKRRQRVIDYLLETGSSMSQIVLAAWPERTLGYFRVIDLPAIRQTASENEKICFQEFLSRVGEELLVSQPDFESFMDLLGTLSLYLGPIVQAHLYRFGTMHLSHPDFLDKIAEKFEALSDQDLSPHHQKKLSAFFDLISFFEMDNQTAARLFYDLICRAKLSHPLKHKLGKTIEVDHGESNGVAHKIGIELEGVPLVMFGEAPANFIMGVDAGRTMPEIRRSDDHLAYNGDYRADLFELWHWARMTHLQGASCHIHLNDPDNNYLNLLRAILGDSDSNIRRSSRLKTAEARFNLPAYRQSPDSKALSKDTVVLDLNQPFFAEQYNLAPLIDFLIEFVRRPSLESQEYLALDPFWKDRFFWRLYSKIPLLTNALKGGDVGVNDLQAIFKQYQYPKVDFFDLRNLAIAHRGPLSAHQLMEFNQLTDGDLLLELLLKFDGVLNFQQFEALAKSCRFRFDQILPLLFERLEQKLTFIQFWKVGYLVQGVDLSAVSSIMKHNLPDIENFNQLTIAINLNLPTCVMVALLKNSQLVLEEDQFDQLVQLTDKFRSQEIVAKVLSLYARRVDTPFLLKILELAPKSFSLYFIEAIEQFGLKLSFDQLQVFFELLISDDRKYGFGRIDTTQILEAALLVLEEETLALAQIEYFIELVLKTPANKERVIDVLLAKSAEFLDWREIVELLENWSIKISNPQSLLHHASGSISPADLYELSMRARSETRWEVALVERLEEKIQPSHFCDWCLDYYNQLSAKLEFLEALIDHVEGSPSIEQTVDLLYYLYRVDNTENLRRKIINKFDGDYDLLMIRMKNIFEIIFPSVQYRLFEFFSLLMHANLSHPMVLADYLRADK